MGAMQQQTRTQQQRVIDLARRAGKIGELCWIVGCRVPGHLSETGQAAIHPAAHPRGWLPYVAAVDVQDGGRRVVGEVVRFLEQVYAGAGTTFAPWLLDRKDIEAHPYCYAWGEPVMVDNVCPECGMVFRAAWDGENVYCDECAQSDALDSQGDAAAQGDATGVSVGRPFRAKMENDMTKTNTNKLKSFQEVSQRITGNGAATVEEAPVQSVEEKPTSQQVLWMKLESLSSNVAEMREVLLRGEMSPEKQFVDSFQVAAVTAHNIAKDKGWWNSDRNDGEMIALMHSELSEALEGIRHGNPASDHIPEFTAVEEEFADVIIRIMDTAHVRGYRVAEAIVEKMKFNAGREYKHGGKKF